MTPTGNPQGAEAPFTPPLPHDPPPPPGYVDPLEESDGLADLTALAGGADDTGRAPAGGA